MQDTTDIEVAIKNLTRGIYFLIHAFKIII